MELVEMNDEKRNEQVSSKVSHSTKMGLKRIMKEQSISSGDILTNYVENESNINAHEILSRITQLEKHLAMIERIESKQNEILKSLQDEHKQILVEIKKLEQLKPKAGKITKDSEENIKNTIRAFFDIKNQHTNVYGKIDTSFDTLKVGKTLCGRYDVTYDVFNKSIELIEEGLDLEEFLSGDISAYGIL